MAFRLRELPFTLEPLSEYKPYTRPRARKLSFFLPFHENFSYFFPNSKDIDSIWEQFSEQAPPMSYSQLLQTISSQMESSEIVQEFKKMERFQPFLSQFHRILSRTQALAFFSQTILDPEQFVQSLSHPTKELFISVLNLLQTVFSKVTDYESRQFIVQRTAQLLVPMEVTEDHSHGKLQLLLPIMNTLQELFWLGVDDLKTVTVYSLQDEVILITAPLKDVRCTEDSLVFDESTSFQFATPNGPRLFQRATYSDVHFFDCLGEFTDTIPTLLINRVMDLIVDPSMLIAISICQIDALIKLDSRETLTYLLALLSKEGYLSIFIRMLYGSEVAETIDESTLFRSNSCGCAISNVVISIYGSLLSEKVVDSLKSNIPTTSCAIESLLSLKGQIPPQINFVLSTVFRATRRRFPAGLAPLYAVSALFVLRYLCPILAKEGGDVARINQSLCDSFVFRNKEGEEAKNIASFLLSMTKPEIVSFPFQKLDGEALVKFIIEHNTQIIANLARQKEAVQTHPLVWSVLELLENCIIGLDEDFSEQLFSSATVL